MNLKGDMSHFRLKVMAHYIYKEFYFYLILFFPPARLKQISNRWKLQSLEQQQKEAQAKQQAKEQAKKAKGRFLPHYKYCYYFLITAPC